MTSASIPIVELLPHGSEMALIDRLIESSAERSIGIVEITDASEFLGPSGVPCWVGIEYMAQTVAARVGFEARLKGEAPPVGYLLGTRRFESDRAYFPPGSRLRIVAEPLLVESGFGSFSCSIEMDRVLATAVLNTYRPAEELSAPDTTLKRGERG